MTPQESFIEKANKKHNHIYDYSLVEYKNNHEKVKIICKKHGLFLQAPVMHANKGNGCPKCGRESAANKITDSLEKYINKASLIYDNKYQYIKLFYDVNNQRLVEIICPVHGSFIQNATNHLMGHECPQCSYKNNGILRRLTTEEYIKKANETHHNKYTYSKTNYITANDNVVITCPQHGDFEMIACWHTNNGFGCPKCSCCGTSNLEEKLARWLDEWSIKYERRKRIDNIEIDFYIPNNHLAFEIDGLFWHSELMGKNRNYHINKTLICEKNNIKLIHIFENEFLYEELIKSKIKSLLNISYLEKIYARKCTVKLITDKKLKNNFLELNHIQGKDNSSIGLGLFFNDDLVAIMTFGKIRKCFGYKNNDAYEMIRYCSKIDKQVIGGAGKLLSYFEKNYKPNKIITYADRKWSIGNLYTKIGFKLSHYSKPSYWYFKTKAELFHRFNFRKNILYKKLDDFKPELSEWENMKRNKYNRIWDCGNLVFEKNYV